MQFLNLERTFSKCFIFRLRYPQVQKSEKTWLAKGKFYYIEADMLEGTGDDHLSVGVKLPNGKSHFPIPSEMLRLRKCSL